MIGIVLVTHGRLAEEFVAAAELAISVMTNAKVEVIAGVNLPMLIKLADVRKGAGLAAAVASAQESGRKYINVASKLLEDGKE
jgi:PTS system mannose-specific IIA component